MHRVVLSSWNLVHSLPRLLSTNVGIRSHPSSLDRVAQPSGPYPLPLDPEVAAQVPRDLAGSLLPLARGQETLETLRARLTYQSRKRGTLEADLLLSTFAAEHLSSMTISELQEFDKLMDEPDWDIYYWAVGKRVPPERWAESALLGRLSKHAANEGKVVRRMPDLPSIST